MDLKQQIALVESQEELLQFNHFSNQDAWELGKIFAEEALGGKKNTHSHLYQDVEW